jgi:nicotinamide-nucleotide amidase
MSHPTNGPSEACFSELADLTCRAALALNARGLKVATAESCTGGWLAKQLTELPGSSATFDCGFICYSNEAKMKILGVPASVLEAHGAVSDETAKAMVAGALARSSADLAVSVSGIAGPTGGTPDKPVGTVWLAVGWRDAEPEATRYQFTGDRDAIRVRSVAAALKLIESALSPA